MIFGAAFLVGGWFYLHLFAEYGTALAFNRDSLGEFSLYSQPAEFYFGLNTDKLFSDPVKPSLRRSIIPIFYTEIWGDYYQHFSVFGVDRKYKAYIGGNYINIRELQMQDVPAEDRRWETNRYDINAYLGRVNIAGLLPTAVLLAGFALGLQRIFRWMVSSKPSPEDTAYALFAIIVIVSVSGFLWFLAQYTHGVLNTAKATYMLQIFPFLAFLSAGVLLIIDRYSRRALLLVIFLLGLVTLHNLPVFFTNYNTWVLSSSF
jgi:hypothetical protein